MTSPTQLQYLEAMGIPVWVSRELVIANTEIATTENKAQLTPNNQQKTIASTQSSQSIEAIMQGLDQETATATVKPEEPAKKAASPEVKLAQTTASHTDSLNVFAKTSCHTVYAQGSLDSDWMVIGQNPEYLEHGTEHETGQPYAAEEGVLLENMLRAVDIKTPRNDAYLVNVLRDSRQDVAVSEQASAELHQVLLDCISRVKPKIIFLVGQLAAQNLLKSDEPLARLRGKSYSLPETNIHMVVSYYPSYLLSKPADKRKAWEDLKLARSLITE